MEVFKATHKDRAQQRFLDHNTSTFTFLTVVLTREVVTVFHRGQSSTVSAVEQTTGVDRGGPQHFPRGQSSTASVFELYFSQAPHPSLPQAPVDGRHDEWVCVVDVENDIGYYWNRWDDTTCWRLPRGVKHRQCRLPSGLYRHVAAGGGVQGSSPCLICILARMDHKDTYVVGFWCSSSWLFPSSTLCLVRHGTLEVWTLHSVSSGKHSGTFVSRRSSCGALRDVVHSPFGGLYHRSHCCDLVLFVGRLLRPFVLRECLRRDVVRWLLLLVVLTILYGTVFCCHCYCRDLELFVGLCAVGVFASRCRVVVPLSLVVAYDFVWDSVSMTGNYTIYFQFQEDAGYFCVLNAWFSSNDEICADNNNSFLLSS